MFLYKFIGFHNGYWHQPAAEQRLYFASVEQLRGTNDRDEFNHQWATNSAFFSQFGDHIPQGYEEFFATVRILCLSKNMTSRLWSEFCGMGGGVCYQFEYLEDAMATDITSDHVVYSDDKNLNVFDYTIQNVMEEQVRADLAATALLQPQIMRLHAWMGTPELTDIGQQHMYNELTFKKHRWFRHEKEFRFVHLSRARPGFTLRTTFIQNTLTMEQLGLKLVRIFSTDVDRVRNQIGNRHMDVRKTALLGLDMD